MKTNTVVLLLLGAVCLGLVGGVLGGMLIGGNGADPALTNRVGELEAKVSQLEAADPASELRVSFVDAEGLFLEVFLPQVAGERQAMDQKQQEMLSLRESYQAGEIDQDEYEQQYLRLQTEALQAQLRVNLAMLEKMLASDGFVGIRGQLQQIRQQAEVLDSELERMRQQSRAGVLDREGFMAQLQALQSPTQQLDQVLTQAAAAKIVEISQQVARDEGYDLALRKKEVVVYWDQERIADITPEVKPRLERLF